MAPEAKFEADEYLLGRLGNVKILNFRSPRFQALWCISEEP